MGSVGAAAKSSRKRGEKIGSFSFLVMLSPVSHAAGAAGCGLWAIGLLPATGHHDLWIVIASSGS